MNRPPDHTPTAEAFQVRPWRPGDPKAQVHVYPIREQPLLWIYADGDWRAATVLARHRYPDQIHYQVDINIPHPVRGPQSFDAVYRWDPDTMVQRPRTLTDAEAIEHARIKQAEADGVL